MIYKKNIGKKNENATPNLIDVAVLFWLFPGSILGFRSSFLTVVVVGGGGGVVVGNGMIMIFIFSVS